MNLSTQAGNVRVMNVRVMNLSTQATIAVKCWGKARVVYNVRNHRARKVTVNRRLDTSRRSDVKPPRLALQSNKPLIQSDAGTFFIFFLIIEIYWD